MADNEERIKITFDTNADEAKKGIDGLNASIDVSVDQSENLASANSELSSTQQNLSKSTKQQKAGLEDLGGGFGSAITGAKGLIKQFVLMLANPIILLIAGIVGALALLFKAFTSTNDGADKFEQVMAGVGAVIDILRDRVLKVGEAIAKFFSGDFKGAIEVGKEAVKGFGAEVEKEFRQAANAAKMLQEVEDATRNLGVARAKLNRDLAESKEIITDETASYADKKKAIEAVRIAEEKQTNQELANAKKKLEAIKTANSLSDTSDADLQKQADAEAALYNLQAESANNRRAIRKTEIRADNEERARLKAIADERKAADKERADREKELAKARKEQRDKELKEIEEFNKSKLQAEKDFFKSLADAQKERDDVSAKEKEAGLKVINDLEKYYADEQIKLQERVFQQKEALENAKIELANNIVGALTAIAGKNKTLQKIAILADSALGIGKSIISANAANVAATAEGVALAIPTGGASVAAAASLVTTNTISAGLGIAANIAATTKALQSLGVGSAGGGAQNIAKVSRASATPQTGFQASSENQIATSITGAKQEQAVVKAYVVSSDMTDQQKKDANLVSNNSFGKT